MSSAPGSIVPPGKAPSSVWLPFPFDVESINFPLSLRCDLERRYSVSNSTSDCVNISWNLLNYTFPNKDRGPPSFMEDTTVFILKSYNDLF